MCSVLGYTVRGKVRDNNGISKLSLNAADFKRLNPLEVVQRSQHNPWKKFIVIRSCGCDWTGANCSSDFDTFFIEFYFDISIPLIFAFFRDTLQALPCFSG